MIIDLVLRDDKGLALTWAEMDNNFTNLANAIIECDLINNPVVPVNNLVGNVLFYGGLWNAPHNSLDIFSDTGILIQPESNIGIGGWLGAGGTVGTQALFYSGVLYVEQLVTNSSRVFSNIGVIVQPETVVGTGRFDFSGTVANSNVLFYGGRDNSGIRYNTITILNNSCSLLQSESNAGSAGFGAVGGTIDNTLIFQGNGNSGWYLNRQTIFDTLGNLLKPEANIGTLRDDAGAASLTTTILVYGGNNGAAILDIFDINGNLLSTNNNIGTNGSATCTGAQIKNKTSGLFRSHINYNIINIITSTGVATVVEVTAGYAKNGESCASI